jgi:hypothetical protein
VRLAPIVVVLAGSAGCDRVFAVQAAQAVDALDGRAIDAAIDAMPFVGMRYMFVTSAVFDGAFGGLFAADAICTSAANRHNLLGPYKAWLSTSVQSARSRIRSGGGPITAVTGSTQIAATWDDLLADNRTAQIDIDDNGAVVGLGCDVWTNTQTDGTQQSPDVSQDCNDWSSNSAAQMVIGLGETKGALNTWTDNPSCTSSCRVPLHLYCVQD